MSFVQEELAGRIDFRAFYESEGVVFRGGTSARCVFHDDQSPSLSFDPDRGLLNCVPCGEGWDPVSFLMKKRGIGAEAAIDELRHRYNLTGPGNGNGHGRPSKSWAIRDQSGAIVATHHRIDLPNGKKTMPWERNGKAGLQGMKIESLPLYGTEKIESWSADSPIIVVEGEKSADALLTRDYCALGTVTGAGKAPAREVLEVLNGRDVVLWGDFDELGRKHRDTIAQRLAGIARRIRVLEWGEQPGDDAADFFARGGTRDQLDQMLADARDRSERTPDADPAFRSPADAIEASPDSSGRVSTFSPKLNDLTRGGPRTDERWGFIGRPGSAKSLGMQYLAKTLAERHGSSVVHIPSDEGDGAAAVRLGQMLGFDRDLLEKKDPAEVEAFRARLNTFQYVMADPDEATLEAAAERLKSLPEGNGPKVLVVDTINNVMTKTGEDAGSSRERFEAIMDQLKAISRGVPCLVIFGAEANRASWAAKDPAKQIDQLASGAESRAIEHGCSVLLVMNPTDDETIFEATLQKNRPGGKIRVALRFRLNKDKASLTEIDEEASKNEKDQKESDEAAAELKKLLTRIYDLLEKNPDGLKVCEIKSRIRGNSQRVNDALDALEATHQAAWVTGKYRAKVWKLTSGRSGNAP